MHFDLCHSRGTVSIYLQGKNQKVKYATFCLWLINLRGKSQKNNDDNKYKSETCKQGYNLK